MDFLNDIYFNNTVKAYLTIACIIVFVFALKKLLSKYLAGLLFIPLNRIFHNLKKEYFSNSVVKPLGWFIALAVSVIALDKLNFPQPLFFKIYGINSQLLANKIGLGLIVFSFFWVLLSVIDFVSFILVQKNSKIEKRGHGQLIPFFRDLLKVIIGIIGFLIFISAVFNKNIGSLLTGLSIVGAALALSAKESLENLIASFIIFFDKPFFIGDSVKMNDVSGTVEHIGLRSTSIRTVNKTLVTVPNKQMVDNPVDNVSTITERRMLTELEFAADSDMDLILAFKNELQNIIAQKQALHFTGSVLVSDYSKTGIKIIFEMLAPNMPYAEFAKAKDETLLQILKAVHQSRLTVATNQSNLIISSPNQHIIPKQP